MSNSTLSPFERFQLEKYGNILPPRGTFDAEEYEFGAADRERDEELFTQYYENELLKD